MLPNTCVKFHEERLNCFQNGHGFVTDKETHGVKQIICLSTLKRGGVHKYMTILCQNLKMIFKHEAN